MAQPHPFHAAPTSASERRDSAAGLARRVQAIQTSVSLDICFLIDLTSSMQSWISEAKEKVISLADYVRRLYPRARIRLALVGYRDYEDKDRFVVLPFTEAAGELRAALESARAVGGGDTAEDVAGGLKQTCALSWRAATRCLVWIADAPALARLLRTARAPRRTPRRRTRCRSTTRAAHARCCWRQFEGHFFCDRTLRSGKAAPSGARRRLVATLHQLTALLCATTGTGRSTTSRTWATTTRAATFSSLIHGTS